MSIGIFWAPLHGQGQTSNIHATGFIMSLLHKKKVLMMQTHFEKNNLESPLVGQNSGRKNIDNELFQDIGLDTAVNFSGISQLNQKLLESCCITFPNISLLLLPGTETKNRETFDRDIGKSVYRMIRDADEIMDVVLIDANSGNDELSLKLMPLADMIVINLTQRRYVLEKYFSEYGDHFLNNKKVFYLFGDYDDNSTYNINNCRRKFSKYLNSSNSGVIPYCTKYMDAQNECNVLSFMREGLHIREENNFKKLERNLKSLFSSRKYVPEETEYFFHRARLTVEKMFDLLYVPVKKDHREERKT